MINDRTIEGISSTSYDLSSLVIYGIYSVKIKAVFDATYGWDSKYSVPLSLINLREASDITIDGLVAFLRDAAMEFHVPLVSFSPRSTEKQDCLFSCSRQSSIF